MKSEEYEIALTQGGSRSEFAGKTVRVEGGRLFWRRALKAWGSPNVREVRWLVAEVDGVRVYMQGDEILITKRDVNP